MQGCRGTKIIYFRAQQNAKPREHEQWKLFLVPSSSVHVSNPPSQCQAHSRHFINTGQSVLPDPFLPCSELGRGGTLAHILLKKNMVGPRM